MARGQPLDLEVAARPPPVVGGGCAAFPKWLGMEVTFGGREKHRPVTQAVGSNSLTDDAGRTDDAGGWSGARISARQRGSDGFWRCDFGGFLWFSPVKEDPARQGAIPATPRTNFWPFQRGFPMGRPWDNFSNGFGADSPITGKEGCQVVDFDDFLLDFFEKII